MWPGGVDDVDLRALPVHGDGGAVDRDAALLLLRIEVHAGRAVVNLADAVVLARVEQDAFGDRGLARVDVGNDADVAEVSVVRVHGGSFVVKPQFRASSMAWSAMGRPPGSDPPDS